MNKLIRANWLRLVAIAMLFGAFATLPYAYYQLMNWVVVGAALMVAKAAKESKKDFYMWLFILAAVVFNPVAPLYLSAAQWRIADAIGILLFFASLYTVKSKQA